MPSVSPKQARFFSAIAHGWQPPGRHVSMKVAKEFHEADKGKKWGAKAEGGPVPLPRPRPSGAVDRLGNPPNGISYIEDRRVREGGWPRNYEGNLPPSWEEPVTIQRHRTIHGYAGGGTPAPQAPWYERGAMYHLNRMSSGFLKSGVPGRTDKLNLDVAPGSYVLPADTISHLGQSNSLAGARIATQLFKSGMRGANLGLRNRPRMGRMFMAEGGDVSEENLVAGAGALGEENPVIQAMKPKNSGVPIKAAGSEFILTPEEVTAVGHGDLDRGHKILDQFVLNVRKHHIETLKKLPKPKQ